MNTVERLCCVEHTVVDSEGTEFTLKPGEVYTTSRMGEACNTLGPEPEKDHVVVFSRYWVSAPIGVFQKLKEKENDN